MLCKNCENFNHSTGQCQKTGRYSTESAPIACVDFVSAHEPMMLTPAENQVYFCAFRYCLGRMTNVVETFCDELLRKLPRMHDAYLMAMATEIREALKEDVTALGAAYFSRGGKEAWRSALHCIEHELLMRKEKGQGDEEDKGDERVDTRVQGL